MTYNTNITYSITYTTYNDSHKTTNDYEKLCTSDYYRLSETTIDY